MGLAGEFTQTSRTRARVAASSSSRSSAATCSAPAKRGADVVGGVRDRGTDDDVARLQAQQERQPGHEFLGPDGGHDVLRVQPGHAAAAVEPARDRLAQRRRAVDRGVAGGVGGGAQRVLQQDRRGVHRGADGEVDDSRRDVRPRVARYGAIASHG